MKRLILGGVVLFLSISFFYFFIVPSIGINQLIDSIQNANLYLFSLALVAVGASQLFASVRWSFLMKAVNAPRSQIFLNSLATFSIGQVMGLVVPSRVGAYAKVPIIMKMDKLSYETGVAAVNVETIFDLAYIFCAGLVSFFILSSFFQSHPAISLTLFFLGFGLILIMIISIILFTKLKETNNNLMDVAGNDRKSAFVRIPAKLLGKISDLILSTKDLLKNKVLIIKLGITTLISQFFGVVGLFLVIGSVYPALPFHYVFALLTISYLMGIVSMVPGGFGASDLSLIVLLGSEGVPLVIATNIAILWRIAMYLPIFLIIGMFSFQQKLSGKSNFLR
jgi:uncharacterized protein (TIRG00374 family)